MLDSASKALFHGLASSTLLKTAASRFGMRGPTGFARRFIAGETTEEAIAAARLVEARGLLLTLDHLGERVSTTEEGQAATADYLAIIDAVIAAGIGRNLSLKLTQLGLDVDRASAVDNLRTILARSEPAGFFLRIDMENSPYTEVTLDVFETLWQQGHRKLGVVLQAMLHRTEADLERMIALGAQVRLVKGAYQEPRSEAFHKKSEVDAAFARLMKRLLLAGHYPAIATHDPALIDLAKRIAAEHAVATDRFEFQMLHGIRRDLQASLAAEGYRMRIYIPYGREWFPYFMRRLGERPANVAFVVRSVLGEGAG